MAGANLASAGATASAEGHMERLQQLLSRYDIRLAFGRSRFTGQPVIRLVEATSGRPSRQIPGSVTRALAGLAAEITLQRCLR